MAEGCNEQGGACATHARPGCHARRQGHAPQAAKGGDDEDEQQRLPGQVEAALPLEIVVLACGGRESV